MDPGRRLQQRRTSDLEIKNSFEEYREKVLGAASDRPEKYMIRCLMTNGRIQNIKWSKFLRLAEKFRDTKERYGLRDGDRVYLLTPYTADALLSFAVLSVNHLTVVFGDPGIPKEELIYQTGCTEVSAVFADRKLIPALDGVTDVPVFSTFGLRNDMALVREAERPHTNFDRTPESLAIIFSSGTTSRMKPVEITYEAMLLSHKSTLKDATLEEGDADIPSILVFPMNHISGLAASMSVLQDGFTAATVEKLDSVSLVKMVSIFEPKTLSMVPKVLAMFINRLEEELRKQGKYELYLALKQKSCDAREKNGDRATGRKLMEPFRRSLLGKNMRNIYSGGGPCPPDLAKGILDLGFNFVVNYSSTECGVPIAQTDSGINDCYDCVGRADRDPNVRIKINMPDADGIGEIYVNSRYIMRGYYNDPEKTAEAFDGEWFRTGDNGYIDERGYLHISGRSKDSIMLESGKKVSPDDIEIMLMPLMGLEIPYSVVGVTDKDSGYDRIHIFIAGDLSAEKQASISGDIRSWQRTEAALYPVEGIHFIKELPRTSIGKIKRVKLREMIMSGEIPEETVSISAAPAGETAAAGDSVLDRVNSIVARVAGLEKAPEGSEDLTEDLGLDSLAMLEICNEIENEFGVFIGSYMRVLPNTREIADYIGDPFFQQMLEERKKQQEEGFDAFEFPAPRTEEHRKAFESYLDKYRSELDFEVRGLENIEKGESYIFCPNHQTHADGLWVWLALGDKCPPLDSIGCMAKAEHLDDPESAFRMTVLGGIPVDRDGNTMDSFRRSIDYIREGNSFLIHPEGTRTRNGRLGEFKDGAAQMAIDSGVSIVPVAIDGGLDVWSYDMERPETKDPETGEKKKLRITFCRPISPDAGSAGKITAMVRRSIASNLPDED